MKPFQVLVCVLIIASMYEVALGQSDVITVDTKLVLVPVMVLDRQGKYVTGIPKEEFRIFEEGVEQKTEYFEPVEKPFAAFLLLDRSGSMSGTYREQLAEAASVFVKQLGPEDQIMASTFADDVVTVINPTKVGDLKKGVEIGSLSSDSTTLIYDAVDAALARLKKRNGRKALILFSDGVGDGRFSSAKENLRDAEEQDVIIYTVQFDTSSNIPEQYKTKRFFEGAALARRYMIELANVSGGRHFQIAEIDNLAGTFRQIAEELGRQYALGYYPNKDGKKGERRRIKVTVDRPDLVVRSRTTYLIDR
jgi:Ca-activated chloride channel homolog